MPPWGGLQTFPPPLWGGGCSPKPQPPPPPGEEPLFFPSPAGRSLCSSPPPRGGVGEGVIRLEPDGVLEPLDSSQNDGKMTPEWLASALPRSASPTPCTSGWRRAAGLPAFPPTPSRRWPA